MITKSIEIAKGVKINYIETEKFKTNYFSFNFVTEIDEKKSPLNSLVPRILTHASASYPSQAEIDKRLQFLYSGSLIARNVSIGKFHIFGILADMLNDKYTAGTNVTDEMIKLVCDIVFNPYLENGVFSEQYTESEKLEIIDAINAEINNKGRYALNRCTEIMCEGEVFSIKKTGNVEDVEKITPKALYEAYLEALKKCRIEIYAVGKLDIEKIADALRAHFSKIEREPETIGEAQIVKRAGEVKRICEIQDVSQGKLCMGFRTGRTIEDGDYHIAQLFCEVYGGSPTSKLFVNVREKKSLCYTCRSMITQKSGLMYVSAGIEPSNLQIAEDAILEQLENVKRSQITSEELDSAKKSLKNGYMNIYDSPSAMEMWTLNREISGNFDEPIGEAQKVDATTIEQIAEYARGITLDTVYFLKGEGANG